MKHRQFFSLILVGLIFFSLITIGIKANAEEYVHDSIIYFNAKSFTWNDPKCICCSVYEKLDNDDINSFYDWKSKETYCTDNGKGIWEYNLTDHNIQIEAGKQYFVIFYIGEKNEYQTVMLDMDINSIGGTVYGDGTVTVIDPCSDHKTYTAHWNQYENVFLNLFPDGCEDPYGYHELYYHLDEDGGIDWVLISTRVGTPVDMSDFLRIGNRVLIGTFAMIDGGFRYSYAVYCTETGAFIPVEDIRDGQFAGLEAAVDALEIGVLVGDIDRDGEISVLDATMIQRYLAKLAYFDDYQYTCLDGTKCCFGDIDGSGETTILDATCIQRRLAHLA